MAKWLIHPEDNKGRGGEQRKAIHVGPWGRHGLHNHIYMECVHFGTHRSQLLGSFGAAKTSTAVTARETRLLVALGLLYVLRESKTRKFLIRKGVD